MKNQTNQPRRKFLQHLALLAGGTTVLAQQGKLQLLKAAFASGGNYAGINDHKSLVCIYLGGGNDHYNMLVPMGSGYDYYASVRQNLAIPQNQLRQISSGSHGFHPAMPRVEGLYNTNKIALVSNVGNLIEPLTRDDIINNPDGNNIPPDLFSHSHQTEFAQTNQPRSIQAGVVNPGWGGLMGDCMQVTNTNPDIPPLIGVTRAKSLWLAANQVQQFGTLGKAIKDFSSKFAPGGHQNIATPWNELLNLDYSHALQAQAAETHLSTQQRISEFKAIVQNHPITTPFGSNNDLAINLKMIARLISARQDMSMKRQFFFTQLGGFDTHGNQFDTHNGLLGKLDNALGSFYDALTELGVADSVTTFTLSEFGRSLTINGDGTDHGWGTHNLVMGNAVDGGKIHGQLPDITLGGPDDSGSGGRPIPKISVDQYGATLAKWMDITAADQLDIFPNLGNFTSATRDIGFML